MKNENIEKLSKYGWRFTRDDSDYNILVFKKADMVMEWNYESDSYHIFSTCHGKTERIEFDEGFIRDPFMLLKNKYVTEV